jgi:hypothetical protein
VETSGLPSTWTNCSRVNESWLWIDSGQSDQCCCQPRALSNVAYSFNAKTILKPDDLRRQLIEHRRPLMRVLEEWRARLPKPWSRT